ncbi:alpha/beta hydrolase [Paramylibacter kogurei]|nr:alpha/beta hydrolase [Amylibacter kogurei]
MTRISFKSVLARAQDVQFLRRYTSKLAKRTAVDPKHAIYGQVQLATGTTKVKFITAKVDPKSDRGALLYIHGGGFVFGTPEMYRHLAADIAGQMGMMAYLPKYRLAPENPYPDGINDIKAAYQALLDAGINPKSIVIGGDSAGGCLMLLLLSHLLENDLPLPACCFAISPVVDLTFSSESIKKNARADCVLPAKRADFLCKLYFSDNDPADPKVSPITADFTGAPPILLHASSKEILRDDSIRMTKRLVQQKVEVRTKFWQNNYHVFHILRGRVKEADQAVSEIAKFALKHLQQKSNDN